jgi:hypothetical protein
MDLLSLPMPRRRAENASLSAPPPAQPKGRAVAQYPSQLLGGAMCSHTDTRLRVEITELDIEPSLVPPRKERHHVLGLCWVQG